MSFYEYTKKNDQLRIFPRKDLKPMHAKGNGRWTNSLKISIFIFHVHVRIFANFVG